MFKGKGHFSKDRYVLVSSWVFLGCIFLENNWNTSLKSVAVFCV